NSDSADRESCPIRARAERFRAPSRPLWRLRFCRSRCHQFGLIGRSVSVSDKPLGSATETIVDGGELVSEFTFGTCGRHPHFFAAHANGIDGDARLLAANVSGPEFVDDTGEQSNGVRNFHSW